MTQPHEPTEGTKAEVRALASISHHIKMGNKLELTYKNIKELIAYVNNSRTHDENQVTQIASSIKEFGFTNPVLIDGENGIIAGHGRVLAAKKLNIENIPCIELSHLSDAQKKAYVIADNRLALSAGWDNEILQIELENLKELDFDIDMLGFDDFELESLLNAEEKKCSAPEDFREIEESVMKHECPRCGFQYD